MFAATLPWTFRPTFIGQNIYRMNHVWGESPRGDSCSVGRNISPHVHGVKRLYMGRTVSGEKSL